MIVPAFITRSSDRKTRRLHFGRASVRDSIECAVELREFTNNGTLIEGDLNFENIEEVDIYFSRSVVVIGRITWRGEGVFGCQFDTEVPPLVLQRAVVDAISGVENQQDEVKNNEGFGTRLRQFRTERNLLQGAVAAKLGVSAVTVSYWESDRRLPRMHRVEALAEILKVPVSELLGGMVTGRRLDRNGPRDPRLVANVINRSRIEIANAVGVPPTAIRISIDL